MIEELIDLLFYPFLLFCVLLVLIAILFGISDYMDGKEDKSKR